MAEFDIDVLNEDMTAVMKTAMASPPWPKDGTASNQGMTCLLKANPIIGPVAAPMIMSALAEWGSGIQKMIMALNMLGIKMDLAPVAQSTFEKKLFQKESPDD